MSAHAHSPRTPPSQVEAHVWWARREDASPRLTKLLDAAERQRLANYRRACDRDRFVVGRALAKTALEHYLGVRPGRIHLSAACPRCGREHGKPNLVRPAGNFPFSISHSGDLIAVAFASAPVGIDIELADSKAFSDGIADFVLSDGERRALDETGTSGRVRGFFACWTRKEAVVKAAGVGLLSPKQIIVSGPREAARLIAWPHAVPPENVSLFDLKPRDGHVGSLAVLGYCEAVVDIDGSPVLRRHP